MLVLVYQTLIDQFEKEDKNSVIIVVNSVTPEDLQQNT